MEEEKNRMEDYKIRIPDEFTVFRMKYPLTSLENNLVFWDGDNHAEFFATAREMGCKFIYVYREKERDRNNEMDIEKDEFGFLVSGVFHVLSARIDPKSGQQIRASKKPEEKAIEDAGSNILTRSPEEIASDMASYVRANLDYMSPDPFNLQYFFKKFWESHGVNPSLPPGSEKRRLMTQIENAATAKIKKL
ncbi:MAG: hypothetical protein AAE984_07190 [Cuniculiplasma divulgatum]|jgi:hypothetical protein